MGSKKSGVSCYVKAAPNEELFVLRAQDLSAPATIIDWIARNIGTAPPQKLRTALKCALRMRLQQKSGDIPTKLAD